jgi:DNA-directed RNA polymerase
VARRDQAWRPHRTPPKPWTGWQVKYPDRLRAQLVRDWRPHVRPAIEAHFAAAIPAEPRGPLSELAHLKEPLPFLHADGQNALKAVPLRINQDLLPLVAKFAVPAMRRDVKKIVGGAIEIGPHGKKMRVDYDVVAGPDDKKLKADRRTVKADLDHARWCGDEPFYLDYNCDKRGRLNALQDFNYMREDHVRALFEFARPAPLVDDGAGGKQAIDWLQIHVANCYAEDQTDKKPWDDRLRWARDNIDFIERVAAAPEDTFDPEGTLKRGWRNADKPFAFVAACKELSRALKNPESFETHLPIGFDCTANGLQHLVLLSFDRRSQNLATERDWEAARLVNLVGFDIGSVRYPREADYRAIADPAQRAMRYRQAGEALVAALRLNEAEAPQDVYQVVGERIVQLLEGEDDRLFTKVKGRTKKREDGFFEAFDRDWRSLGMFPDKASARAAIKRLPKPQGKSKRDAWCFGYWRNRFSEMDRKQKRKLLKTPTMSFAYSSTVGGMADEMVDTYFDLFEGHEPENDAAIFLAKAVGAACRDILPGPARIMKYIRALALHRYHDNEFLEWISPSGFPFVNMYHEPHCDHLDLSGGVWGRYTVANGASRVRRKTKMLNTASPNFIHSLDAAHLIRTVLEANRDGIHDILTVHDSFACLAPFARRFGQIIRREMAILHALDPLRSLSKANGDPLPLPQRGNIDPLGLQNAEYLCM